MKDPRDTKTKELIDPPKRGRGRPKTGDAMTSAERQRAYRLRNAGHQAWTRPTRQLDRAVQLIAAEIDEAVGSVPKSQRSIHLQRASGMADMAMMLGVLTQDEYSAWSDKIRNASR